MERLSLEARPVLHELPRFRRRRVRPGWQTLHAGARAVRKQLRHIVRNNGLKIGLTLFARPYVYICEDY